MSLFKIVLLWLGQLAPDERRRPPDPDRMNVHDWADLPPHHPASEAGCAALKP